MTSFGLFEFPVMCFGLRNAAQTFQRLVNSILNGLDYVFAYVDDVLIVSSNKMEHNGHVRAVLERFENTASPLTQPSAFSRYRRSSS